MRQVASCPRLYSLSNFSAFFCNLQQGEEGRRPGLRSAAHRGRSVSSQGRRELADHNEHTRELNTRAKGHCPTQATLCGRAAHATNPATQAMAGLQSKPCADWQQGPIQVKKCTQGRQGCGGTPFLAWQHAWQPYPDSASVTRPAACLSKTTAGSISGYDPILPSASPPLLGLAGARLRPRWACCCLPSSTALGGAVSDCSDCRHLCLCLSCTNCEHCWAGRSGGSEQWALGMHLQLGSAMPGVAARSACRWGPS